MPFRRIDSASDSIPRQASAQEGLLLVGIVFWAPGSLRARARASRKWLMRPGSGLAVDPTQDSFVQEKKSLVSSLADSSSRKLRRRRPHQEAPPDCGIPAAESLTCFGDLCS